MFGFIVDNLTLTRIDLLYDNAILLSYLIIIGASILFLNAYETSKKRFVFFDRISLWIPIIMQFMFGGLFSGFVVFYSRSATLAANWPFILGLIALLIGNETFRTRYKKLNFQIALFFVGLFSYFIFSLPILFKSVGAGVFFSSGAIALIAIWLVIFALFKINPEKIRKDIYALSILTFSIYLIFNFLYFTNVIPPIPLSLKEIGVYHKVARNQEGKYIVEFEPRKWYDIKEKWRPTFHRQANEPVYIFSSVFAPTKINTTIFHQWYYFDAPQNTWVKSSRVGFPIFGGQDGGWRGYSLKENVWQGKWRVDVVTDRNQIIGRITFTIKEAASDLILKKSEL